jgi:hypothetical protein
MTFMREISNTAALEATDPKLCTHGQPVEDERADPVGDGC